MLFSFGPKSSILLIFFSQALVFSFLLLRTGVRDERLAHKWLAFFVFLGALYICPFMLGYAGWYANEVKRNIMFYVPFQQLFLIGPVLYFYVKSLLSDSFVVSRKDFLHFLPAALYMVYSLVVFIGDILVLDEIYFYADGRDKDLSPWYQWSGWMSMVVYLGLSLRHYYQYRKRAYEVLSYADIVLFKWMRSFLIAFLIVLILRVLFFILNPEWAEFGRKFWYYLSFSVLFYYIALSGYFNSLKSSIPFEGLSVLEDEYEEEAISVTSAPVNELENLEDWKSKILDLMHTKKMYENNRLTLNDVAKTLGTNPKLVSKVVNQGFEMNFNDFVNHYRIKAVIQKLELGEHNEKTLLGIAMECGFNSKATFNRAFKKHTQLSPKNYLVKTS